MKPSRSRRSAVTLFELILVCAILVVVAVLSAPSLQAMYAGYKLNGAIDSVRAAWAEARARAIDENRPYRFSVQPAGGAFRVAPDDDEYWAGGAPANDPNGRGLVLEQSLPSGVRFSVNGECADPSNNEGPAGNDLGDRPVNNSNWSTTCVFHPNGTAGENVTIQFRVRGARPTSLYLRGLTGNVTVQAD
jgi:Tfp pilus assembly protein FimT